MLHIYKYKYNIYIYIYIYMYKLYYTTSRISLLLHDAEAKIASSFKVQAMYVANGIV